MNDFKEVRKVWDSFGRDTQLIVIEAIKESVYDLDDEDEINRIGELAEILESSLKF